MGYFDVDKGDVNAPSTQRAPEPGLGSVPEYLVSALPWVTSSTATTGQTLGYSFPKVSSFVQLINHGSAGQYIRIGFTKNGVEIGNYIRVDGANSVKLDVRVKDIFIRSDAGASPAFSLAAGLTMIPSRFMPTLTGSVSASSGLGAWDGVG